MAPGGRRLVFERAFGSIVDDNAAELDLVVANADGSGEQAIRRFRTREGEGREAHDAQWSPSGRRIAVMLLNITARPRGGSAIYVLDADGTDLRRITPMTLNAGNADWSPDGRRIALVHRRPRQLPHIWAMRRNGTRLVQITRGALPDFPPAWGGRPR